MLSDTVLKVSDRPVAAGALADTHEGTFKDLRVRVDRVRVYSIEGQLEAKVRHLCCSLPIFHFLRNPTDVLPRGYFVEAHESPKRCTLLRSYLQSSSIRLELGASCGFNGMRQHAPRDKSTRPRGCPFYCARGVTKASPTLQLCDIAEGLNYLHSHDVVHGSMKGVCVSGPPAI